MRKGVSGTKGPRASEMPPVSRYKWPSDKRERLALIVANLTCELPQRGRRPQQRAERDEVADTEPEVSEGDDT